MDQVATTAVWMAVLMAAWTVLTGFAGARRDTRLATSGARALHATAALTTLAVMLHLAEQRGAVAEAPFAVAATLAVRSVWTDVEARLIGWAAAIGIAAMAVTFVTRREGQERRVRAQVIAGSVALAFALIAALGRYFITGTPAEDAGTGPVPVQVWPGIASRLLYALGIAGMLVPVSLRAIPTRRATAYRWTLGALALTTGALALAAWVRFALVAPPAALDADGTPIAQGWSTTSALWAVPALLIAAHALTLLVPRARGIAWREQPAAQLRLVLLAVAAVLVLGAFLPAVYDWTEAREIALGMTLHPPLLVLVALPATLAVLAIVGLHLRGAVPAARMALFGAGGALSMVLLGFSAGVRDTATLATMAIAAAAAALTWVGMAGRGRPRLLAASGSAMLLTIALGLAAMSIRPVGAELEPGTVRNVEVGHRPFRLTSQGTSQVEELLYDGAVVAFEAEFDRAGALVTAGERIYRDPHGHPGTRVAVPGIVHGAAGDLRLVVQGIRGHTTLVQVQYHPLVLLAWLLAGVVVVSLSAAALGRDEPDRMSAAEEGAAG